MRLLWKRNRMGFGLAFTPSGRLTSVEFEAKASALFDEVPEEEGGGRLKKVARALAASQGEELFSLATERFDTALPPSLAYWRQFATRYLTALCHTPESPGAALEATAPPGPAELTTLILNFECPA